MNDALPPHLVMPYRSSLLVAFLLGCAVVVSVGGTATPMVATALSVLVVLGMLATRRLWQPVSVFEVRLDGGTAVLAAVAYGGVWLVRWLPDGNFLAALTAVVLVPAGGVLLMDLAGRERPVEASAPAAGGPRWSSGSEG